MARSSDPLVVGRVIGDVLEPFVPSVELTVKYESRQVNNGCELKPSATAAVPKVQVGGKTSEDALFTLVMTDPDAPSPSEPSLREWLHWLVTDIRGGSDARQGREVVPYAGPKPPIGIHRYIFVLFKQQHPLPLAPPTTRHNFNVKTFAQEFGLGLPVAAVYYNAQKETGGRRR
ncbi:unnamed protein product [Calypogeia fissa]